MEVYEVSTWWVLEIFGLVSGSPVYVQDMAHRESNFRISVCEYDAPTTMLGSVAFEETFLELLGLLRQNGEVVLLKMVSWSLFWRWKCS